MSSKERGPGQQLGFGHDCERKGERQKGYLPCSASRWRSILPMTETIYAKCSPCIFNSHHPDKIYIYINISLNPKVSLVNLWRSVVARSIKQKTSRHSFSTYVPSSTPIVDSLPCDPSRKRCNWWTLKGASCYLVAFFKKSAYH